MIKKSLLVFLALFILYSIFISFRPEISLSQHQWQENVIKAQKYIYNDNSETFNNIIVGSSLSGRFVMDSLPSFYNLSFSGLSIFDGLKIIKNKGKLPKNVFIETNAMLKEEDTDFTNTLFSPVPYFLEKHFMSLRADKQPVSILIKHLTEIKAKAEYKIRSFFKKKKIKNKKPEENKKTVLTDDDFFNKMLKMRKAAYSEEPDKIILNKQLLLLAEYVKYLQINGVNVCFFELPVNSNLVEMPRAKTIRNEIYRMFPVNKYNYVMPDSSLYKTADGIHLNDFEGIKYTTYFKSKIKEMKKM